MNILPLMAIIRAKNHLEEYRARTLLPDIAELSSRSAKANREVAAAIVPELKLSSEDVLVDVGCGDGSLLVLVQNLLKTAVGICPTPEEVQRVKQQHAHLDLREGTAQHLPLAGKSVSRLVCNSVILVLETEVDVALALREFARVTNGLVYVGEVPAIPVTTAVSCDSPQAWLKSLWRHGGAKSFLAGCRDLLVAALGKRDLIFCPDRWLCFSPDQFIQLAEGGGLKFMSMRTTPHSPERRDYVFYAGAAE